MTQAQHNHPLFYQNPVALDKSIHGKMSLASPLPMHFCKQVNAVPITLVEMQNVMPFYPIAFSAHAPASPLAIIGLRNNENLFVNQRGEWIKDTYIPAYIRRYPFIFSKDPQQPDRLTLCIDDSFGILEHDFKNPIFDDQGELTETTKTALDFCRSFQLAAEETEAFAAALESSNILIDRHAEIRLSDDQVITLSGFRQIDEEKFNALSPEILAEWHRNGWLGAAYAMIFSDRNWEKLFQLLDQ